MANWQCPNCETLNEGDVCVICGGSKPKMPFATPATPPPVYSAPPTHPIPSPTDMTGSKEMGPHTSTMTTTRLKFGKGFKDAPVYVPEEETKEHPYIYEEPRPSNTAAKVLGILAGALAAVAIIIAIAVNA